MRYCHRDGRKKHRPFRLRGPPGGARGGYCEAGSGRDDVQTALSLGPGLGFSVRFMKSSEHGCGTTTLGDWLMTPSTAVTTDPPEAIDQREMIFVGALVTAFVMSAWANSLYHYFAFRTGTGDFSIFEQSIYNTLHGRFMYNTFEHGNHLAIHFSLILLLFVPVGMAFPSAVTLAWLSALRIRGDDRLSCLARRPLGVGARGRLATRLLRGNMGHRCSTTIGVTVQASRKY